jgi:uncharacterized repeat protein (TIGR01451 family)
VAEVRAAADARIRLKARMMALETGADLSEASPAAGDIVGWKIVVRNVGQATLTNVVVTDTVARWQAYHRGSIRGPGRDDSRAPHMRWTIPSLRPGHKVVVSFHTVIVPGTPAHSEIANQARVDSDQTRPIVTDDPFTTKANDATVIDPPAPRRWWLVWLAVGLAGGLALGGFAWRRRRAAVTH